MFHGTAPGMMAVYGDAIRDGRSAGRRFVGAEHLLLALIRRDSETGRRLRSGGLAPEAVTAVIESLAGVPAVVATDVTAAASLGVEIDPTMATDLRPSAPAHRILPLGWRRGRRWCEQASPPVAGDAEAAYESALYLALARWHRTLEEHHLAEVLLRWSRGSMLVAVRSGADVEGMISSLAAAHPARRRVRSGHVRRARALATDA